MSSSVYQSENECDHHRYRAEDIKPGDLAPWHAGCRHRSPQLAVLAGSLPTNSQVIWLFGRGSGAGQSVDFYCLARSITPPEESDHLSSIYNHTTIISEVVVLSSQLNLLFGASFVGSSIHKKFNPIHYFKRIVFISNKPFIDINICSLFCITHIIRKYPSRYFGRVAGLSLRLQIIRCRTRRSITRRWNTTDGSY